MHGRPDEVSKEFGAAARDLFGLAAFRQFLERIRPCRLEQPPATGRCRLIQCYERLGGEICDLIKDEGRRVNMTGANPSSCCRSTVAPIGAMGRRSATSNRLCRPQSRIWRHISSRTRTCLTSWVPPIQGDSAKLRPSVGLLLCRSKDKVVVEYALRNLKRPLGVSE
jgi:hypothetical protein